MTKQSSTLELSLAQRNQELSLALRELQGEAQMRRQAEAEAELQGAHDELESLGRSRTAELEQAILVLMRQEKQLALSRLVVGVAHEMNRPLGNARMSTSTLHDLCRHLLAELQSEQLRRSDLRSKLQSLVAASHLIDRSLERAALLVQRFNALATSQHAEACAPFEAVTLLQSCLQTWRSKLADSSILIELAAPAALPMKGFPRALQEALFQLFENTVTHGWAGRRQGLLRIVMQATAQELQLDWQDDGAGIAPQYLPHVMEPFFTTQLGQSGTGLGLSTVNSLVCDLMAGTVTLGSAPGAGCRVRLSLPLSQDELPAL